MEHITTPVFIIGVDGLGGKYISPKNAPFITSLFSEGTYSTNVQSVLPAISASNWRSLFTGVPPEKHGTVKDERNKDTTTYTNYPSLFELLDPTWKDVALYYTATVKPAVENHITQNKVWSITDKGTLKKAVNSLKQSNRLSFVHFDYVDIMGHTFGYGSSMYDWMVRRTDRKVKRLVHSIQKNTTIVIVSDHGGKGRKHKDYTVEERTAFFVMGGPRIGLQEITEINMHEITPLIAEVLGIEKREYWK